MEDQTRTQNGVRPEDSGETASAESNSAVAVKEDVQKKDFPTKDLEEKGMDHGQGLETKKTLRRAMPQFLATSAKNMLLLAYGMTLGFPTIVIPSLQDPNSNLRLTKEQISWFSSINLMTVPLGCLISGALTDKLGKKRAMIAVNIPFLVSWALFYWASSPAHLYSAMILSGLAGGLLEAPVLTYVAEITEPHLRGFLSATASSSVILGIFLEFLFGTLLVDRSHLGHGEAVSPKILEATSAESSSTGSEGWRLAAAISSALPMIAMVALFCVPESPHWLIAKGRLKDAEASLRWLRGWAPASHVKNEFDILVANIQVQKTARSRKAQKEITRAASPQQPKANTSLLSKIWVRVIFRIQPYLLRTFCRPFILICVAFFVGHFCGMTTLQTFAVSIYSTVGSPIDGYTSAFVLGIVELMGTLICVLLIHWQGKRRLSIFSTTTCGICFLSVATFAYLKGPLLPGEDPHWAPIVLLTSGAFFAHMGIRLLPWILIGEVYPPEVRAMASGASGSAGYIFGFAANKSFFSLRDSLTLPGVFWFNGGVAVAGAVYLYFALPETEGHQLHEIQQHYEGKRDLRKEGVAKKSKKQGLNEMNEKSKWAAENPAMAEDEVGDYAKSDPKKAENSKDSKIEYESRL